jgi:Tfp pilus assembly protein FimT
MHRYLDLKLWGHGRSRSTRTGLEAEEACPRRDSRRGTFQRNKRLSARGSTVLELLFSAGLIISLAAVATPKLLQMRRNFSLQSNLRLVQVMIQSARYNAISQGVQYQLVFSGSSQPQFQMKKNSGTVASPNFVATAAATTLSGSTQLSHIGTLTFDPSGVMTSTGFAVDTTSNDANFNLTYGSRTFQVFISRMGRVRIIQTS